MSGLTEEDTGRYTRGRMRSDFSTLPFKVILWLSFRNSAEDSHACSTFSTALSPPTEPRLVDLRFSATRVGHGRTLRFTIEEEI